MKKVYEIPATWVVFGKLKIEASSKEEAIEKAYEEPLPKGEYIEDTFQLEEDAIKIIGEIEEDEEDEDGEVLAEVKMPSLLDFILNEE